MAGPAQPQPGQPSMDIPVLQDGDDSFILGTDSYTQSSKLLPGEYVEAMNCVNRGGMIQTRPGSQSLIDLPAGNPQGLTFWTPIGSQTPYLVFVVDGSVYTSPAPFTRYTKLKNVQFNKYSKYIAWASCVQSTDYDTSGLLYSLPNPKGILLIQDGNTRAAYWDGTTSAHINPTPTPRQSVSVGVSAASNTTPIVITLASPIIIGTGEQVQVSDIVGNLGANGTWTVTVIDSTHLSLNGSSGTGSFVSSGSPVTIQVVGATHTTPIGVTTASPLFIQSGETVTIQNVQGNTNANGTFIVTVHSPTQFELNGSASNGVFIPPSTGSLVVPTLTASPSATLTTNPTVNGDVATLPGFDGTPVGLWMVWSNNRLWVSRGSKVFASDLGNPLKFTDDQFAATSFSFLLPGVCTGAVESPDKSGVIFFTRDVGVLFLSSIQDRTQWLSTAGFQTTILPNTGCCAPRSIVQQYGLIWWFTPKGLISQNAALSTNITSAMYVQDNEMISSKSNISYDLSMACGCSIENYLLTALPHGDKVNNRVHVLDQAPYEGKVNFLNLNSWPGFWTGWRPVEFARGTVGTADRIFCVSNDYDGVNRLWELFRDDKTDNGTPITSYMATRNHFFQSRDYKKFKYAEIEMVGVSGPTAVAVYAAGLRGAYQRIGTKDIQATQGQIYAYGLYGNNNQMFAGSSRQTRVIKTEDMPATSEENDNCVETEDFRGLTDKAFSILVSWSGIAGITAYRIFCQLDPYAKQGTCEDDEPNCPRLLNSYGAGTTDSAYDVDNPFVPFFATATYSQYDSNGVQVSATCTQSSTINLQDAERKAGTMAQWYVGKKIGTII